MQKGNKGNTIMILNENQILDDTLNLKGSMSRKAKP